MKIAFSYGIKKPSYKNLWKLQNENPALFVDDMVEYNEPFLRTLDLIYSVKPSIGGDNKLHLDFQNKDKIVWSIDMKKSVFAWNQSKYYDSNEDFYQRMNAIKSFESEKLIEGTFDAMWGIVHFCRVDFISKFLVLPYIDTFNLMNEYAFIFQRKTSDGEKINESCEFLCNLFRESLEKWPKIDTDFTHKSRNAFLEKNVFDGISRMMECIHSKLPEMCTWKYYDH